MKEDNEGVCEFLQEVHSSTKGSMREDGEVLAMIIMQMYWASAALCRKKAGAVS